MEKRPAQSTTLRHTFQMSGCAAIAAGLGVVTLVTLCAFASRLKVSLAVPVYASSPPANVDSAFRNRARRIDDSPISIDPRQDLVKLVSHAELREVLERCAPNWGTLKIVAAMHAFRLWGPTATFDAHPHLKLFNSEPVLSGEQLVGLLLDHRAYRALLIGDAPLLFGTRFGIGVRTRLEWSTDFAGSAGHIDDVLCACAEVGLPRSYPVYAADRVGMIDDLLQDSVMRFDLEQELEWSVEAFARYLAPQRAWTNRFGMTFDFDQACRQLLDRSAGRGACFGTHVPHALACVLAIDRRQAILSPGVREAIMTRLANLGRLLEEFERPGGGWDASWSQREATSRRSTDETWDAVTVTGHHLEWIAIAPESATPRGKILGRAVRFLIDAIVQSTDQELSTRYLAHSHAARALVLMANTAPEAILNGE